MIVGFYEKSLTAADGTRLCYQVRGEGPAVVFANGLGGRYSSWQHQIALFDERFKVLSWDYRGLFRSSCPADRATLSVERQAADLIEILDAERVEQALLVGWSMGVHFSVEVAHQFPDRVAGLCALGGSAGLPFGRQVGPRLSRVLAALTRTAKPLARLLGPLLAPLGRDAACLWAMERWGLIAPSLDRLAFAELMAQFARVDFDTYLDTLARLGSHDGRAALGRLAIPTLVVAGARDCLFPPAEAQALAAALADVQLVIVEGGTHCVPLEYPQEVNDALWSLVCRVYPAHPAVVGGAAASITTTPMSGVRTR